MKRQSSGFWVLWSLALVSLAGCSASESKNKGMLYGALAGAAIGIGTGYAIGANTCNGDSDNKAHGGVIGAGAGALLGGLLGYWLAPEDTEAPPPAPAPAPRPTTAAPAPQPSPPTESKKIVLRGINFDFDKATIKNEFVPVLDEAARILKDNPNVQVIVEGHTDSKGSDEYNQRLSERRAKAVKQYLESRGIAASRLEAVGKGEKEPIADNTKHGKDNPEGRALNRRAELKVK
jgi:outer membrane protein OmpA-like peptidoglycan-associated protein